jgi:hypothetical protein
MKSSGKRKFRPGNGFEINVFASPCPAANASIVAGRNRTRSSNRGPQQEDPPRGQLQPGTTPLACARPELHGDRRRKKWRTYVDQPDTRWFRQRRR